MLITKKIVADKIAAYLHHDITLAQLVDWAEHAMMEDEFEESGLAAVIRSAVSRLGVGDVRAFGLTREDCEELLGQLGFDKVSAAEKLKAFMLSNPVRGVDIKALIDEGRA